MSAFAAAWPDRLFDVLGWCLALVWVFAFGASWGSFLNVVVYRLPRGMNLSWPPSACPRCGTAIRRRDNVPVFGWLLLRGRCRACQLPIAARYPAVEMFAGALLVGLVALEIACGTTNLPGGPTAVSANVLDLFAYPPWKLVRLAVAHSVLLFALLALALIGWDGGRVSGWKFWCWIGLPFAAACLHWRDLMPVAPIVRRVILGPEALHAVTAALAGAGLSGLLGICLFGRRPAAAALLLAGTYLGPFAVLPISLGARLSPNRLTAAAAALWSAGYLASWKWANEQAWLPRWGGSWLSLTLWTAAAALAAGIALKFQGSPPADESTLA